MFFQLRMEYNLFFGVFKNYFAPQRADSEESGPKTRQLGSQDPAKHRGISEEFSTSGQVFAPLMLSKVSRRSGNETSKTPASFCTKNH